MGRHAGISLDVGQIVYGFNPAKGAFTTRNLLNHLKRHLAVPSEVRDDTQVFKDASLIGLQVEEIEILVPQAFYDHVEISLAAELKSSNYTYGYPDGDCNCATWIERLGVPLFSGQMDELMMTLDFSMTQHSLQKRRFGLCTP